jgi:hypothetical protein
MMRTDMGINKIITGDIEVMIFDRLIKLKNCSNLAW